MNAKKPLVFVLPLTESLSKLKEAVEEVIDELDVEIFEVDEIMEINQLLPTIGQAVILFSSPKKCALALQSNKKFIQKLHTKILMLSPTPLPRKTVDKFTKLGLTEFIPEPVNPKTLMFKVKMLINTIVIKTDEEEEKVFTQSDSSERSESALDKQRVEKGILLTDDEEENDDIYARDKKEKMLEIISDDEDEKKKKTYQDSAIETHWGSKKKKDFTLQSDDEEEDLDKKKRYEENTIDSYYKGNIKSKELELNIEDEKKNKNKMQEDFSDLYDIKSTGGLNIVTDDEDEDEKASIREELLMTEIESNKKKNNNLYEEEDPNMIGRLNKETSLALDQERSKKEELENLEDTLEKKKKNGFQDRIDDEYMSTKDSTPSSSLNEDENSTKKRNSEEELEKESKKRDEQLNLSEDEENSSRRSQAELKFKEERSKKESAHNEDEEKEKENKSNFLNLDESDEKKSSKKEEVSLNENNNSSTNDESLDLSEDEEKNKNELDLNEDKKKRPKEIDEGVNLEAQEDDPNGENQNDLNKNKKEIERERSLQLEEDEENFTKKKKSSIELDFERDRNKQNEQEETKNKSKNGTSMLNIDEGEKKQVGKSSTDHIKTYMDSREGIKHKKYDWDLKKDNKNTDFGTDPNKKKNDIEINFKEKKDLGEQTIDYSQLKKEFENSSIYGNGKDKKRSGAKFNSDDSPDTNKTNVLYPNDFYEKYDLPIPAENIDSGIDNTHFYKPQSNGIEVALKILALYENRSIKFEEIITEVSHAVYQQYNAHLEFYQMKMGQSSYEKIFSHYQSCENFDSEYLRIKESEINTRIKEFSSFNIPTWRDDKFISETNCFYFPFLEGIEKMGYAYVDFPNGVPDIIKNSNGLIIETMIEPLRGLSLSSFHGGNERLLEYERKKNSEEKESSASEKPKEEGKVLSFFGKFFKRKSA